MVQNRDAYEGLALSITRLLQILHEEVTAEVELACSSQEFEEQCKEFYL